jgi:hypothetical protein
MFHERIEIIDAVMAILCISISGSVMSVLGKFFLSVSFSFFHLLVSSDQGLDLIKEDFADNPIEQYEKHEKKVFSMIQYSREKLMKDVSKLKKEKVNNGRKDDDTNNGNSGDRFILKKEGIEANGDDQIDLVFPKDRIQRPDFAESAVSELNSLKRNIDRISEDQEEVSLNQSEIKKKKVVNFVDSSFLPSVGTFEDSRTSREVTRKDIGFPKQSLKPTESEVLTRTEAKENSISSINTQSAQLKIRSSFLALPPKSTSRDSIKSSVHGGNPSTLPPSTASLNLSIVPSSQIERLLNQDMTQSFYMVDTETLPSSSASSSSSCSTSQKASTSIPVLVDSSQSISLKGNVSTTSAFSERAKSRFQKSSAFFEQLNLDEENEWG